MSSTLASLKGTVLILRSAAKAQLRYLKFSSAREQPNAIPLLPEGLAAQSGLAMACIVKNEAPYLREWVEFHLMLGARRVFVYDNGSTDDIEEVLADYTSSGEVVLTPWRSFCGYADAQRLAYAHAIANFGREFRWMAFIDVDEFLFPTRLNSLPDAFEYLAHLPSVTIPWRNFGPNGHKTKPAGLVIENYLECAPYPPRPEQRSLLRHKTVVDPLQVAANGSHAFRLRKHGAVSFNQDGRMVPTYAVRTPDFSSETHLQLNHYFTRSEEEMRARFAKGRVSRNGQRVEGYMDRRLAQYQLATTHDDTILRFVPRLRARLSARSQAKRVRQA